MNFDSKHLGIETVHYKCEGAPNHRALAVCIQDIEISF